VRDVPGGTTVIGYLPPDHPIFSRGPIILGRPHSTTPKKKKKKKKPEPGPLHEMGSLLFLLPSTQMHVTVHGNCRLPTLS